jgi:hypothetical protein
MVHMSTHSVERPIGSREHDLRDEQVGTFAGRIGPEAPVGKFAGRPRRRRQAAGGFAGDPDRHRQGSFGDVDGAAEPDAGGAS